MRKFFSILLLAVLGLPAFSSFLASGTQGESSLLACCRRLGKHHCVNGMAGMANMGDQQTLTAANVGQPHFAAPVEKCPYAPAAVASGLTAAWAMPAATYIRFADPASHPAGVVQTESKLRISLVRTRQKRGPPAATSL